MEEPAGYAALEARLDERDSALLASIVIADELGGETDSLEHAQQCLHSLATVNRDARKGRNCARSSGARSGREICKRPCASHKS